ncbi:type I restriction endonuclease subunit R [Candidatus Oscillochloris fontis]|uniref:type I restriction endonuclease subunit R n=1 Tax=Candidatus Oscillochloris fontis TaxID=2496868 RepID=UPI00101D7ABA|nr:HsdR family type I site-specific deoxyribonuclease [Candidatus Oscillochloris fontis]
MTERTAVQNPMLRYAEAIGWKYVPREEALRLRGGETGRIFTEVLTTQLRTLNPGVVDVTQASEIVRQLSLLNPTIEGNRDALAWLRGERSVFVPEERRERNVRLIDFDQPDANVFQVTDEWTYRGTVYANRADVVFLINGIPIALAETKAAAKKDGLEDGVAQVRRYHRETPELLITPQLFEVTQLLDFFYGITWNTSRKSLFNWKEEEPGNYERKVKAFFDRARLLRVLRDYIVFLNRDDTLSKLILRQHQTRAVERVLERVAEPTKQRGLIWHTQGSGKTLTMITIASKLLREAPDGEKPTVLMIVDRNELEAQLFKNITGYGIATLEVAASKRDLQKLLADDYRGLIVSMIHKFDSIPANLNLRHSVVVLVDEAHRTTGGDLGTYLLAALPNATYIGFTGTPIDKLAKGQGTFKVFGVHDAQGYLDKYNIAESVEDGTTVRLNYALAPSDLRVDREMLEREFLDLADAEGVSDFEELNAILRKAVTLSEALKSAQRVAQVAAFVAQHFRENVEPLGFKAFLVAVDRDACVRYKEALDLQLPKDYSQVVISPAHNDPERLKAHYLSAEQEKDVRKAFTQKGTSLKILIVTEKLLTGFDAPILYAMYLDKPMRDHVLLQAIARVNRPYEDDDGLVKPYGFVLDFVGIFEKLERALAFDADVVTSVLQNLDVLRNLFATQMHETAPHYLPLTRGWDDKAKECAIEHFEAKEQREAFYTFYRQIQMVYDVLSPDAFLRPYLNDYEALAALYHLIRTAYSARPYTDRDLTDKTRTLLHEHTTLYNLTPPTTIHSLGAEELTALKQSDSSDTVKVLNLRRALAKVVDEQATSQPFLISIGEQAESVAQAYEDRQLTTQQALAAFEALAKQATEAAAERQRLGLDANGYAIYVTLTPYLATITSEQINTLNAIFQHYPDYGWDNQQESALRTALYQAMLPLVGQQYFIAATTTLMKLQRV